MRPGSGRTSPPAGSRSVTCRATTTPTFVATRRRRRGPSTTACAGRGRLGRGLTDVDLLRGNGALRLDTSVPDRQPSGGRRRPRLPGAVDVRGRVPVTSGNRERVPGVESVQVPRMPAGDRVGAAGGQRARSLHLPRPARRDRLADALPRDEFRPRLVCRVPAGLRRAALRLDRNIAGCDDEIREHRRRPRRPRPADCGLLGDPGHGRRGCRPRGRVQH